MDCIKAFSRMNIRYDGAQYSDYDDVAVEDTITFFVNDMRIATLVASPDMLRELCIGYLISEGVVNGFDEIQEVVVDENKWRRTQKSLLLIKWSFGTKLDPRVASASSGGLTRTYKLFLMLVLVNR